MKKSMVLFLCIILLLASSCSMSKSYGSKETPAPIGTAVTFQSKTSDDEPYIFSMTMKEVTRDEEAAKKFELADDEEALFFTVEIELQEFEDKGSGGLLFSNMFFTYLDENFEKYENSELQLSELTLNEKLSAGDKITRTVVIDIPKDGQGYVTYLDRLHFKVSE
ncbi:MAG: hypothetical protein GXZ11_01495 [Tissierellia bacterium]|nr:hypothetical protein [Tissierellia bacterium]